MTDKPKSLALLLADRLQEGIMRGPDHPNTDDELLRWQAGIMLRKLTIENATLRSAMELIADTGMDTSQCRRTACIALKGVE